MKFKFICNKSAVVGGSLQRVSNADGVYEKDKERLANMMAFGQDIAPSSETSKVVRRPQKPEVESDEEIDRFQERKHHF